MKPLHRPPTTLRPATVPDATPGNWVDRIAPATWQPYLRLARFDRPIGAWLLLFPCWWGQALAELSLGHPYPKPWYLALFLAGAFVMRGAGCTYNDIVDRDYDARVARTAARPIPSGQVSVAEAQMFLAVLCIAGFVILIQFNLFTIALGAASLAARRHLSLHEAVHLLAADRAGPDVQVGRAGRLVGRHRLAVVGAARALCRLRAVDRRLRHHLCPPGQGGRPPRGLEVHGAAAGRGDAALARRASTRARLCCGDWRARWPARTLAFFLALALAAVQLAWQVATLDAADPANCLARFKSNRLVGWLLLAGLAADMALVALADAHY